MIPVDQNRFVEYDANDVQIGYGNCMQASVASLLELGLSDVPNFIECAQGPQYCHHALRVFLEDCGFDVISDYKNNGRGSRIYDGYYLAWGTTPRGTSHMVVMRDGALAHDPHPSREGLHEVKGTYAVIGRDPAQLPRRLPSHPDQLELFNA